FRSCQPYTLSPLFPYTTLFRSSVSDTLRDRSSSIVFEDYLTPAYNFRMTDLQAAVGRQQMARLDGIVMERRKLAERYISALAANTVLEPPCEETWSRSNWQSFPVFLREGAKKIGRASCRERGRGAEGEGG